MKRHALPIGDSALLSDCRSAALVSTGGSVDWLCFPRFDGPSLFARLLDPAAGHWSIRPVGDFQTSRTYVEDTMLLQTTFHTLTGVATVVDALAVGRNDRGHELGAGATSALLRRVSGVEEAGKHRWAVEAWKTQPVDRAACAHQGRRTAVGQEGIVTDRKIMSLHAPNLSVRCCATRRALAMMVNVGFTAELEQKKLESTT